MKRGDIFEWRGVRFVYYGDGVMGPITAERRYKVPDSENMEMAMYALAEAHYRELMGEINVVDMFDRKI